jgi:hypothetical protein
MKNYILAITLFFTPTAFLPGQFNLGAKGGVNFAKWIEPRNLAPDAVWSNVTVGSGGAFLNIEISEIFGFQVEANFIQKGLHSTFFIADTRTTMNMVEFPILLRANIPLPIVKPYFLAGFGYGVVLSARAKGFNFVTNQPFDSDHKPYLRKGDLTAQFAAGTEYEINPLFSILFEARYSVGLRTIQTYPDATAKTQGIQIQAGITTNIL